MIETLIQEQEKVWGVFYDMIFSNYLNNAQRIFMNC